jgi:predicted NBD/HSP70 family sugar kinase
MMRFYKQQHEFYCGVDLHAKTMHVCLVNQGGEVLVHRNLPTEPDRFLNAIALYRRQDLGRAVYLFLNSRVSLTF